MSNKSYTANGWLTAYALRCGYVHSQRAGNVRLFRDANCYTVCVTRQHCIGVLLTPDCPPIGNAHHVTGNGHAWFLSFNSLPAARAAFREICGGRLGRRVESASDIRRNVIA